VIGGQKETQLDIENFVHGENVCWAVVDRRVNAISVKSKLSQVPQIRMPATTSRKMGIQHNRTYVLVYRYPFSTIN